MVRSTEEIRADLAAIKADRDESNARSAAIHHRACVLLREARDHPELTIEVARGIVAVSRQTAYEMARDAFTQSEWGNA